jgi:hypothetical protein
LGLAKRSSEAISALATIVIAAFTITLWIVGNRQHKAAMRGIALAREEFIASHRPRLHIRTIYNLPFSLDSPITAQVILVNRGDTTATIETVRAQIFTKGEGVWPDDDVVMDGTAPSYDPRMLTGEDRIHVVRSKELRRAINATDEVSILGQIVYRDDNLIVRRTGFLWRLDFASRKFEPVEDRARNYED